MKDVTGRKTMSFNMETLTASDVASRGEQVMLRPHVDDGAPYSAIELFELRILHDGSCSNRKGGLKKAPKLFDGQTY